MYSESESEINNKVNGLFPYFRQSYDIHITATVDQSGFRSGNILDLKNPFFRLHLFFPSGTLNNNTFYKPDLVQPEVCAFHKLFICSKCYISKDFLHILFSSILF